MIIGELISKYPELYHMADNRNWDNISRYGLLSTSALLDLFEYEGDQRYQIESQLRLKKFRLIHPVHGTAIIRDQDPLRDRPEQGICLKECLVNTTPQEWFELLNRKTFFWATIIGLKFMLNARLYRDRSHLVLTVDTGKLVRKYKDKITLSALNTGSLYSKKGPKLRSKDSFKPIHQYRDHSVTEVAVENGVPDILDHTIAVEEQKIRGQEIEIIRTISPR